MVESNPAVAELEKFCAEIYAEWPSIIEALNEAEQQGDLAALDAFKIALSQATQVVADLRKQVALLTIANLNEEKLAKTNPDFILQN